MFNKLFFSDMSTSTIRCCVMLSILFWVAGLLLPAEAQPAQRMEEANQAYLDKHFQDAITQYEALLQEGYRSEVLYYNLGNAYYRSGVLGRAVLNYERALKLSPGDEKALLNLEVAGRQLKDDLLVVPESSIVRWWRSAQGVFSSGIWASIGLGMLWLGFGGLALWLLHPARRFKKLGFAAGWIFLTLCIFPFLLGFGRVQQEFGQDYAIVLVDETNLWVAPDEESQPSKLIHEGAKVRILDAIGSWYQVRLSDTTEGWLPKDVVERV